MKAFIKLLFLSLITVMVVGCEGDDDKFSGTPVGVMDIVTLKGQITTPAQSALTDQLIDFTVTLPRTFNDTVTVEATSISNSGRRIRAYVDVMPNELTATGEIYAAGGAIFDTTFDLYLSGIALQTADPVGTHFLLESDKLAILTGSSAIPAQNSNRLIAKLVWLNASTANNLQLIVDRPTLGPVNVTSFQAGGHTHNINVLPATNESANVSSIEGDYIFSIKAGALTSSPVDMPYRLILVWPNGDVEVFSGVYSGLTLDSPLLPIAKVNKSIVLVNGQNRTVFTPTNLIN